MKKRTQVSSMPYAGERAALLELVQRVQASVQEGSEPDALLDLSGDVARFARGPHSDCAEKIVHSLLHVIADQDVALSDPAFRASEEALLREIELSLRSNT